MKGDEMSLIAQLLLESSTCAYLEWLVKEVKCLRIKLDFKDELLVMLFAKQNNQQAILPFISLRVGKYLP
jgi:hypothetical protein